MDAFDLIEVDRREFGRRVEWTAALSTVIGEASTTARSDPKGTENFLRSQLSQFIASPVPSEELRTILRGYLA